jgi:FKBP-type peptidyl-prolyl cis-trans isomerase SlyD
METIRKNKKAAICYSLRDATGTILEEVPPLHPLFYLHGYANLVPGLERALEGHKAGDRLRVPVPFADGYGPYKEDLVLEVPKEDIAHIGELWLGMEIEMYQERFGSDPADDAFHAPAYPADIYDSAPSEDDPSFYLLREIRETSVIVDGNHPLAGMDLLYDVEILAIADASITEIEMGYPDEEDVGFEEEP